MKVFQCMIAMNMLYRYDRYNINPGQIIRAEDPKLVSFFTNHNNIREVNDPSLLKIAPPIQAIKQPIDPHRMRKDDILAELRNYGIVADQYTFCEKLSMQLRIARKTLKRNFITILNEKGYPIYIDESRLPVPALTTKDESLPEPDDVVIDERDIAMTMDEVEDENEKANEGLVDFEDWVEKSLQANLENEEIETIVPVVKETEIEKHEFEEKKVEIFEVEKDISDRPEFYDDEEEIANIDISDYLHLIEPEIIPEKFLARELEEDEAREMQKIKWTKVNIQVLETFLRTKGIQVEYTDDKSVQKRWDVINTVKGVYELAPEEEQQRMIIGINLLQKRYDEISLFEPDYRGSTERAMRKRCTELSRFGVKVWYRKDHKMKKFARKLFTLAKLGLNIPDTDEEIDSLLEKNRISI